MIYGDPTLRLLGLLVYNTVFNTVFSKVFIITLDFNTVSNIVFILSDTYLERAEQCENIDICTAYTSL